MVQALCVTIRYGLQEHDGLLHTSGTEPVDDLLICTSLCQVRGKILSADLGRKYLLLLRVSVDSVHIQ